MISSFILLIIIGGVVAWAISANKPKPKRISRIRQLSETGAPKGEPNMKEVMLEQMSNDLEQSVQTDKTVIIIGLLLNMIFLGVNTGVAAAANAGETGIAIDLIFLVLTAFLLILNGSVGYVLITGKQRRVKLAERVERFWNDEGFGKYQDDSVSKGFAMRGNLFTIIILSLGGVVLLVSLITYFFGST